MEAEAGVASCDNMVRSIVRGEPLVVLAGLLAVVTIVIGPLAAEATAGRSERPADELTRYVAQLRSAAKAAESARSEASSLVGPTCAAFGPTATQVASAAASAEAVFRAYRNANTRYGTQEEILLIAALATDLREARGHLARAAGETTVPSQADQRAAGREVSLFQSFVALEIQDRLEIEGLADLLTARSFAEIKARVVSELQRRFRDAGTAELRRITGLRISLDAPLKQQLRSFLDGELSRALAKLAVSAGPAGIIISVFGGRIVSLVGAKLTEALRQKGNLAARTRRSVAGFASLQQQLRQLPRDATLTRVRSVARAAERALNATAFLEGDLKRKRRLDLAAELHAAKTKLEITLNAARVRFLLDSALFGEDFGIAVRYSAGVRSDARRLAKKLGCPLATGSDAGTPGAKGVAPTASSCPASFSMESLRSLPPYDRVGEFTVRFSRIERTYASSPFNFKCLYVNGSGNEAFVIFIDLVPPDAPGAIASGACGNSRPDNPPTYYSRKRYLTVSAGERAAYTRASGGNEKIARQALALAEAQGVGQACPN